MDENTKTRRTWGPREWAILSGEGIDIGCGPDPLTPEVQRFDLEHGDANEITKFVNCQFDFVYSSHCLEHMHKPQSAILEWWKLVKPGGHLFVIVPDEDLYEQGVFPSRFNPDHKATFTISKTKSWSPVSVNLQALMGSLPNSKVIAIDLHDRGYDRNQAFHGPTKQPGFIMRPVRRIYFALKHRGYLHWPVIERMLSTYGPRDQTLYPDTQAQIQCIVQKLA